MLSHDRKGFLVPDTSVTMDGVIKGVNGIKRDTALTVALLKAQLKSNLLERARVVNPNSLHSHQRQHPGGDSSRLPSQQHQTVRQITQQKARDVTRQRREAGSQRTRDSNAMSGEQKRDSRGQFLAIEDSHSTDDSDIKKADKGGILPRLASKLSGPPGSANLDTIDPAMEATSELRNLLGGPIKGIGELGKSVIGRGFSVGGSDKPVPWYRRMLLQMKLMRKDESEYHRAELRLIQARGGSSSGGERGTPKGLMDMAEKALPLLAKLAVPAAIIASTIKSFNTSTDEYADRLGEKNDGGVLKEVALRTAGVLGDIGNTLTFGLADKLGKAIAPAVTTAIETASPTLKKLMPGYRKKVSFEGVNGGAGMANFGSYTEDEAAKIRVLKASGANTSANLERGMPRQIQEKIVARADAAGIDPTMMLKITAMESGGNVNAISKTGAIGLNQFTGRTATGVGIKDRFDVDQNIDGGIKLAQQNIQALKKANLPLTAENVYLLHQLGADGGKELIRGAASGKDISSLSAVTQSAVAKNFGAGSKTAAQYVAKNKDAIQARYDSVIGRSAVGSLPKVPSAGGMPSFPGITVAPGSTGLKSLPSFSIVPPGLPTETPRLEIPVALNSKGPMVVTVKNDRLASQDIADRRLSHIATGGISAA